jgi:rubrerythrin
MSTGEQNSQAILSVEELLAHAHPMEVHNNPDVAALFRKLSEIEGKHIAQVAKLGEGKELPQIKAWEYKWGTAESPETPEVDAVHYMMTPYLAIGMALRFERQAVAFFERIIETSQDTGLRAMAEEMVTDEREHVRLLSEWQARYPEPDEDWDEDPDPPNVVE